MLKLRLHLVVAICLVIANLLSYNMFADEVISKNQGGIDISSENPGEKSSRNISGIREDSYQIGEGTVINSEFTYPAPYGNYYFGARHQMLIRVSELNSAGITGPGLISSIGFDVETAQATALQNFTIKIRVTDLDELSNFIVDDLITVWGPQEYTDITGWNDHILDTPFFWDGLSNLLIETSFENSSWTSNAIFYQSATDFTSTIVYRADTNYNYDNPLVNLSFQQRPNINITYDALIPEFENDLSAFAINGPEQLQEGFQSVYTVSIMNFGSDPQDNYTIELRQAGNTEPLDTQVITTPLDSFESIEVELSWIPEVAETTDVYGRVVLAGDENPDNDETGLLSVTVNSSQAAELIFPFDGIRTFNNPELSWDASEMGFPAAGFSVYLDNFNPPTTEISVGNVSSYQTQGLDPGETYYWQIVALNDLGTELSSEIWSFDTIQDGFLAESFEETFPPLYWEIPGEWNHFANPDFAFHGTYYLAKHTSGEQNLLKTPKLHIENDSVIEFFAGTNANNAAQRIQMKYSEDGLSWTNIGEEIELPPSNPYSNYNIELGSILNDISSNKCFIAFSVYSVGLFANVFLDYVRGPEIYHIVNDLAAIDITGPQVVNVGQTESFLVEIKNLGSSTQDNYVVELMQAGSDVPLVTEIDTESLETNDTTSVELEWIPINSGNINIYARVVLTGDENLGNNETASLGVMVLGPPLAGSYNINSDGTGDFDSFTAVVDYLTDVGIAGEVILNIAPGVYEEQVTIPEITGTSVDDRMYFIGSGSSPAEVLLTFSPSNTNQRHIVKLNGAKHLSFENMTFSIDEDAGFGYCIHIQNQSEDISFTNNVFNNIVTSSSNYVSILASNSNLWTGTGNTVNDVIISDNIFNDGYAAIRLNGESANRLVGIEISNNDFNEPYYYGIYLSYIEAPQIVGNFLNIRSETPRTNFSSGISLWYIQEDFLIANNEIINAGRYGILLSNGQSNPSQRSSIVNNSIGGGFRSGHNLSAGIRTSGTFSDIDIFYNSINADIGRMSALYIDFGTVSGLDIRNNSLTYSGGEDGYALRIANTAYTMSLDYNNYFNDGSNFVIYGTAMADLAELQAVDTPAGNDSNSNEGDPGYTGGTNLYPVLPQLIASGTPIAGIEEDINGNLRSITNPTIGAYEFISAETPDLIITPSTADFLAIAGFTSDSASFNLSNTGQGTLIIEDGDIVFTGIDGTDFNLDNVDFPIEIEELGSTAIDVVFAPASGGDKQVTMLVNYNGDNSPYEVILTGYAYPIGTVIFGEGESVNLDYEAVPINVFHNSLRGQMVYPGDELSAAGIEAGDVLTSFGFFVEDSPSNSLPDFRIRMAHTNAEDNSQHIEISETDNVYFNQSYQPVAGDWDMLELDTPFIWNGQDNILIDTAFSPASSTLPSGGQQRIYNVPNGFRFIRQIGVDVSEQTTTTVRNYKPQARMQFTTVSPGPTVAHNPLPADNVYNVTIDTMLGWTYTSDQLYTDPEGFRLLIWTDETAGDPYEEYFEGGPGEYLENVSFEFDYDTEYHWQVIPTTGTEDAENVPTWSFTTEVLTFASATYILNDIPTTMNPAPNISDNAVAPGFLTVTIPENSIITGVDVEYEMTSQEGVYMDQQYSYLSCVSEGGISEDSFSQGMVDTE